MRELFKRLLARPGIATELLIASLFANILALASPLFVIQVLNRYVVHGIDGTLVTLTSGVILAVLFELAFRNVRTRLARLVSIGPDEALASAGYTVLTQAKASALQRVPAGAGREVMAGVNAIETAYNPANIGAVLDVPFAVLYVAALALLHPVLAIIASVFLIAVFLIATISLATLRKPMRELVAASGNSSGLVSTALHQSDTVRAFNAGSFLLGAWRDCTFKLQRLRQRIVDRQGLVQTMGQSAAALMNVAIISVGALMVVKENLTVGSMIGANILAARALMPITRFAQLGEVFAKARQAMEVMRDFAKLPLEATSGSAKGAYHGGLELRDLAYAFPGASGPLFESVDLVMSPGEILLVTGGNGTGKTTLARLLTGILEPTRGQILVDGLDLRQSVPEWWRRQVVYLPQEPAFLNATIEENLRVNAPDIPMERLNALIDEVGLRKFLDESPKGFDEPIANNGANLSLGTRRRLALARALTTGGRLAIFDEPTEGMDSDGAAAVSRIMSALARAKHTIVVISHDAAAVKGAHAILDLDAKPVPRLKPVPRAVETRDENEDEGAGAEQAL